MLTAGGAGLSPLLIVSLSFIPAHHASSTGGLLGVDCLNLRALSTPTYAYACPALPCPATSTTTATTTAVP